MSEIHSPRQDTRETRGRLDNTQQREIPSNRIFDAVRTAFGQTTRTGRLERLQAQYVEVTGWFNLNIDSVEDSKQKDIFRERLNTLTGEFDNALGRATTGNARFFNRGTDRNSRREGENNLHMAIRRFENLAMDLASNIHPQYVWDPIKDIVNKADQYEDYFNQYIDQLHGNTDTRRENFNNTFISLREQIIPALNSRARQGVRDPLGDLTRLRDKLRTQRDELSRLVGGVGVDHSSEISDDEDVTLNPGLQRPFADRIHGSSRSGPPAGDQPAAPAYRQAARTNEQHYEAAPHYR